MSIIEATSVYTLVENNTDLQAFYDENKNIEWLGFDTEFVGEKRYYTLLCLLQVATEHGFYLIDTLKIEDLSGFLKMIEDPSILKITHAGENDYKILYMHYGTVPKNVFDVQIAAGFIGYKYPTSFGKLAGKELNIQVSKGYTVSDWESRPLNKRQVKYALEDIIYLEQLWKNLTENLIAIDRLNWAKEEFLNLEKEDFYIPTKHKEVLQNSLMLRLNLQTQAFMLRLYEWRLQTAKRKDYSKDMVLSTKLIVPIVKNMPSGKNALLNHRRIPSKIVEQNWNTFNEMYQRKISEEERDVLNSIPNYSYTDPKNETIMELLYLLMKITCDEKNMAVGLLTLGSSIKKMKMDPDCFEPKLAEGWRKELLGEEMILWLQNRDRMKVSFAKNQCLIELKESNEE